MEASGNLATSNKKRHKGQKRKKTKGKKKTRSEVISEVRNLSTEESMKHRTSASMHPQANTTGPSNKGNNVKSKKKKAKQKKKSEPALREQDF